jgi:hypothetical protein
MERTSSRTSHSETFSSRGMGGSSIHERGFVRRSRGDGAVGQDLRAAYEHVGTVLASFSNMKLVSLFAVAALSLGSTREVVAQASTSSAANPPPSSYGAAPNPWVDPNAYPAYGYPATATVPQVPPLEAAPLPAVESGGPTSPGLIVAGVFMMLAGSGGLIAGGYLFGGGTDNCDALLSAAETASPTADTSSIPDDTTIAACQAEVTRKVAGTVSMISGGAFLLAGLPLLIVGATPEDAPTQVSFKVGPTGGGLEVRF